MLQKPTFRDIFLFSCFTVLITFQPYYLHADINFFEYGLYLPGIDAILNGHVPYRDFFHLRGPFELYMPALCMLAFGKSIAVLATYFYAGTIITLIVWVFLAQQLYRTRLILYVMIPVFIARTFPRVVFTYWGGMRYALGALVMLCAVRFFKTKDNRWLAAAGVLSAASLFTSIEIGVCAVAGVLASLILAYAFKLEQRKIVLKNFAVYAAGFMAVAVSYAAYLAFSGSLFSFVDSVYTVVTRMEDVFNIHLISSIPSNPIEALVAMVNPVSKNFRHMTPAYLYIVLLGYVIYRFRKNTFSFEDTSLVCLGVYGLVMYNAAFRAIWASQFEMALQPEKILLFFLFERAFFYLREKRYGSNAKILFINFLIFGFIIFSLAYSVQRYNKRFFAFQYVRNVLSRRDTQKLIPLHDSETVRSRIERVGPMTIPQWQETEFRQLLSFIDGHTKPGEPVFMFPELGTYQFLADRPFVGRFPMVTFSWFNDAWHEEMVEDLKRAMPKVAVLSKDPGNSFPEVYFKVAKNKENYDEIIDLMNSHYTLMEETKTLLIYQRKSSF